ncbi:hypothetical protein PR202_gb10270 [Eleusine coracana subsp. coracana]|uniref:Uncharacterized protein n=1 Tax=Eleusine coracana subsp. coracana TaxID=191504 RepID=A0AAV5EH59_ELECO|nr:hypothetical protein PR202_gb10270 [Eleusine coracana subsp. coracana]
MLNRKAGVYSLRRMDLARHDLFYPKRPRKQKISLEDMDAVRTPAPSVRFHPNPSPNSVDHEWKMDCFGLSENKIFCVDQSGRTVLYDAGLRAVVPMPGLHCSKWSPISFSVPNPEDGGGCLYVMEKTPLP